MDRLRIEFQRFLSAYKELDDTAKMSWLIDMALIAAEKADAEIQCTIKMKSKQVD